MQKNQLPEKLKEISSDKKILNLGCGNDTFGTHRMDMTETNATTHIGDIEKDLPFEDSTFDVVYTQFLFEHLKNPNKVLKEAHRVLKKGGKFILITDNAGFWGFHTGRWTKTLGTIHYGGHRNPDTDDRHYALYTPEHINNHLEKAGLRPETIDYQMYSEVRPRSFWKRIAAGTIEKLFLLLGLDQVAGYAIYAEGIKE